ETLLVLIGSERGRQVNHVLIFPFIIYFLLYVSRHETFDYFPIAYTVTIPTVVAFAMLVVVSMLLRSSGKHLFGLVEERIRKANAISHPERYEREAGDPAKADDLGKDKTANLRKIREEALKADVKRLERAKRNMEFKAYNSPILKGALIPLGGTGILVLMELLANLFK
ncbi:MAG: hypothetical protein HKN82_19280, partial [Akkermansiaceae bacterium]|nr:hypothetical protein [Akkermansiaceae bacterium]